MSIKRNTIWNILGSAGPMIIGLFSVPYILKNIGVEKLGVLTLIWSMIGYFSVFDFGLGRALTQKISSFKALHDERRSTGAAQAGLVLVLLTGVFGAGILVISVLVFGVRWMNVSHSALAEVTQSILIAAIAIPITTATSGLKGILEGLEEFGVVNIYKFILGAANFLSPVASIVLFGANLSVLILFLVASRLLIMLLHLWSVAGRIPGVMSGRRASNKSDARELLVFGSWMTLSNLLSPMMVVADRFVISSIAGAALVAYYTVPSDFLIRLLIIPAALTTTLFPVFASKLRTNVNEAKDLYWRSSKLVFFSLLPVMGVIALAAHAGLALWLGEQFADRSYLIVAILSAGIVFNGTAQIPHAVIQASGNARLTSLIHLCEFLLYAPAIYFAVILDGIAGAAWVWAGRAFVDFLALNFYAVKTLRAAK